MLCQLSYGRNLNVCFARWDSNPQPSVSQLRVVAVSVFQVDGAPGGIRTRDNILLGRQAP